ncbi:MAG: hypothetical protein V8R16_02645 [Bacilli bacterium]
MNEEIKTILMKVYIDTLETKQYFFEAKDEDGKIVSLYRDENIYVQKLMVKYINQKLNYQIKNGIQLV